MLASADTLIAPIADILGVAPSCIKFLRYSQNAVYEIIQPLSSENLILRVTSATHRSDIELHSELEWLQFLYQQGLPVCPAIAWPDGNLLHPFETEDEILYATLFKKAPGQTPNHSHLTPSLYHAHGALLGRLHASNIRAAATSLNSRKIWYQERYFTTDIESCVPLDKRTPLREILEADLSIVHTWPNTVESYGPIHADLGYSNFHIHAHGLTVYDFDNCTLGPLIMDIAAALYGSIFTAARRQIAGDRSAFEHPQSSRNLEAVRRPFKEGYQSFHPWQDAWEEQLSVCLRILYFRAVLHACRLFKYHENPEQHPALKADIDNLLHQKIPLKFEYNRSTWSP